MTPTSTPTPTRRNAATIRRLVLTLTLGLIALVIVALACGPSAPGAQNGSQEPTNTPTPTHTPTPAHQAELGTLVNAVMVKQATIAAAPGGVAGQATQQRPQTIIAQIYTDTPLLHKAQISGDSWQVTALLLWMNWTAAMNVLS